MTVYNRYKLMKNLYYLSIKLKKSCFQIYGLLYIVVKSNCYN